MEGKEEEEKNVKVRVYTSLSPERTPGFFFKEEEEGEQWTFLLTTVRKASFLFGLDVVEEKYLFLSVVVYLFRYIVTVAWWQNVSSRFHSNRIGSPDDISGAQNSDRYNYVAL